MKSTKKQEIRPSVFVRKHFSTIKDIRSAVILDIPSGSGRNALFLQALGCNVICVDNDFSRLNDSMKSSQMVATCGRLSPIWIDLSKGQWPFRRAAFTAIVNVHFPMSQYFDCFGYSLVSGGYLLCETFGGQGENYLQLPKPGEWKSSLERWLHLEVYEEKTVGPRYQPSVTVKLFGRKF